MARVLGALLILGLVSPTAGSDVATPPPRGVPEVVVSLDLAQGYIPLDDADHVPYRFVVTAMDPDTRRLYALSDVLVRPGQKRDLAGGRPFHGSVDLRGDGSASYRVELTIDGRIVARTRATMKLKTSS